MLLSLVLVTACIQAEKQVEGRVVVGRANHDQFIAINRILELAETYECISDISQDAKTKLLC
jgi:hypothetical protein